MANRNPFSDPPQHNNNNLLDIDDDDSTPWYESGRPPAVKDDDLLRRHNINSSDVPEPGRPSISYDNFVGAGASVNRTGAATNDRLNPPFLAANNRAFSQTEELNNYQSHAEFEDDFLDDGLDDTPYLDSYAMGGLDDTPQNVVHNAGQARQSVTGWASGLVGRTRGALGLGPGYQGMGLPLTESGAQTSRPPEGAASVPRRKSTFKFGFNRGPKDYTDAGPRLITLNNPVANATSKFVDNHVSTSKYNIITFLPKFLFEQFSKYANLFFLFTAALQQIPNVSPTSRYTTIVPLIIVLIVSAVKEFVEDFRRKQSDAQLNSSKARVLRDSTFHDTRWINVAVGDIVRVESEEPFPADLVLMASSEPEGLCYIETANLDGETNLKIKQAIPETANLVSPADLAKLYGQIKSEQPNSSLYTYEATLTMKVGGGEKELPLQPDQLLLRGATLRNTPWVYGIVVFTGHETKLMRNATSTPIKKTAVEHMVNLQILFLGAVLVSLSLISSIGDLITRLTSGIHLGYLYYGSNFNTARQFFSDIFTYWVLYSNLVPISLFVTIDIVKYCQAVLINSDLDMYYDKTDTPANCRTSSLVEELGQVEYVFSDKTGTLTCNQMEFRQCSIAGVQYAEDVPEDRRAIEGDPGGIHDFKKLARDLKHSPERETIDLFLQLLSTCHTVIPERKDEKIANIKYQAASPDEGALVEGAVILGYTFIARKPRSVMIVVEGSEMEFELLAVCEFNSTRKRMSAIFRCPDGRIRVFCKGADTVIFERLSKNNPHKDATLLHLEEYAAEGLRTLCLAMREVSDQEFQQWYQVFNKAQTTVSGNRADELDKAAEIIEHDFTLLGATAIEDKLQDGVPDTIHTLQSAGIKVWVLTGDRQETAINIGMSCKLISEDMTLLIVNEQNAEATRDNLYRKYTAIKNQAEGVTTDLESLALIIDGHSLTYALEKDCEKLFLDLAVMCKAVICCRVSPLQKALVVKLVKRHLRAILLAIGDGANDVSMIQAAHVGVGIAGMEGLQAARSADISIGQFRYLRKLLLVHGSWSYYRVSKVILYSFYKNVAMFMTQFWFSFNNGFSGQVIAESWTLSFFNVIFTVLPPFVLGIFDQFVSARLLDRYPQLYQLSQRSTFFRLRTFLEWILNGFYHSLIIYIFSALIYGGNLIEGSGKPSGLWIWGTTVYTAGLCTVLGKAALITNVWTKYHVLAIPGSLAIWLIFVPTYGTVAPLLNFSTEYQGVLSHLYTSPTFWLAGLVAIPSLCLLRDFAWKYARRMYAPLAYHHVQEIQKYNVQDYRPRMEQFQKAVRKVRQVQRMRKQRGYAFSQTDESQARVLKAYDTTRERGRFGELKGIGEGEDGGGGASSGKGPSVNGGAVYGR